MTMCLRLNLSHSGAVTFISFCYKPDTPAPFMSAPPALAPIPSHMPTISVPTKFVTQVPTKLPLRSPVISSLMKATAPSSVPMQAPVADPTFTSTMIPLRALVTAKPTKLTATAVPTHGSDTSSDSPSVSPSESSPSKQGANCNQPMVYLHLPKHHQQHHLHLLKQCLTLMSFPMGHS